MPRIQYVQANVVTGIDQLRGLGPFDLVVAGGLFDYLPDRAATILLRRAFGRLLGADGGMLFTNIATGNPYRCWIEYMGAWKLIERNEDQIHGLLDAAGLAHVPVRLSRDATGLALLVELGSLSAQRRCLRHVKPRAAATAASVASGRPGPDDDALFARRVRTGPREEG